MLKDERTHVCGPSGPKPLSSCAMLAGADACPTRRNARTPRRRLLAAAMALALPALLCGCAADQAIKATGDMVRSATLTILEQSNFERVTASANGRIHSPHYQIIGALVNGFMADIRVDGVEIDGAVQAQGVGTGEGLSDKSKAAVRELLQRQDFWDALSTALANAKPPATAPSPASEPAPNP